MFKLSFMQLLRKFKVTAQARPIVMRIDTGCDLHCPSHGLGVFIDSRGQLGVTTEQLRMSCSALDMASNSMPGARIESSQGIETIQGNAFDAIAHPESFSLVDLNPPYDSEIVSLQIAEWRLYSWNMPTAGWPWKAH